MKRTTLVLLVVMLNLVQHLTHAQQVNLDSLWGVWNDKSQADTSRLKAIARIAWDGYLFTQPDSAFYFAQLGYDFAKKKGLKKQMASALNIQGISFHIKSDYDNAIGYYSRSLKITEEMGDKQRISASLNNIGLIYNDKGDNAKVIVYYNKSLKIDEEMGDKEGMAASLNNIGLIYGNQGDYAKAIGYYKKSLKISEEMGDKYRIASALNNIGNVYADQGELADRAGKTALIADKYAKAFGYYKKSLKISEEIDDKQGMAASLGNIGSIYKNQGDSAYSAGNTALSADKYNKAIGFHSRSLKITEEIGNKQSVAGSLNSIGNIYAKQGDYVRSITHSSRSLSLAQEVGAAFEIRDAAHALYESNKATKKFESSLEMYELFITTRDSINSEENQKEVIRQEYKYEYEKEALADSLEFAKEQEVKDLEISEQQAQLKQEATMRYALMGGGVLFLILALVAFRSYRLKRKDNLLIAQQKEEVENQKELVDEKNKEITDSITYAKRIQEAILPPDRIVKEYLKESFILYKPKDIVAGDFYWMESVSPLSGGDLGVGEPLPDPPQGGNNPLPDPPRGGNTILFAAADCTGHGVPGAMVSVVCHNALNRAVREFNLTDPGKILDKVRELVIETFEKSDHEVKDGMDIALCRLEVSGNSSQLQYAGANNPLWIITKENRTDLGDGFGLTPDTCRLYEVKPDKQPIGKYAEDKPFTTHTIELQQGDSFYIFTDGYPDQFGGTRGKKFKYKPFKQLLLDGLNKPMEEQRTTISESFEQWRGELEQIDDVCVIGVRV